MARVGLQRAAALLAVLTIAVSCTSSSGSNDREGSAPSEERRGGIPVVPEEDLVTEPADDWFASGCDLEFDYLKRVRRGYYGADERSPDVLIVAQLPHFFGAFTTTSHTGPWPYVQDVPLVFYGPGFVRRQGDLELDRETTVADLSPTIAELLDVPWPEGRPGKAIKGVWLPEEERNGKPKMLLQVVWDGGGWNVLDTWPDAWPHLKELMQGGTSVKDVTIGSSPSNTPPIHATMGTGAFPKQHGIINIPQRNESGNVVGSYPQGVPQNLELTTLADLYDPLTENEAKIGALAYRFFHLGMLGHGAYIEGGDKDIAVIADTLPGELSTNEDFYTLPRYLQEVGGFQKDIREADAEDGKIDGIWRGEPLEKKQTRRHSPVWVRYQTRLLKTLFEREGFGRDDVTDLFMTNYKQIDSVGHTQNMLHSAMNSILLSSDEALKELTTWLDEHVGKNEWVVTYTADHGQVPDPQAVGSWPIQMGELTKDVAEHFGLEYEEMFQNQQSAGMFFNRDVLEAEGITLEEISDFLVDYRIRDNVKPDTTPPAQYRGRGDEVLLAAAFPSKNFPQIWRCAQEKRRGT